MRIISMLAVLIISGYCFSSAQTITTVIGSGICGSTGDGGTALAAEIMIPSEGVFDRRGNYIFAERLANKVRCVNKYGIITTVAGTGTGGFTGDNGPASLAELNNPVWVAVDSFGQIYIADINNNRIRMVDTAGVIHTIGGNGINAFGGDGGPATVASLLSPVCVNVDDSGNVYELETVRIRKIEPNGLITKVVGNGTPGFSGDGGPADLAAIHAEQFCFGPTGNMYISDFYNYRVRRAAESLTNLIASIVSGVI